MTDPEDQERLTILQTAPQLKQVVVAVPRLELTVVLEAAKETDRKVVLDGERIRIGCHPRNELVLDDSRVSRFHCTLSRGDRSWTITDSGSLNGTSLEGVRVRDADLPARTCEIELGESRVRVAALAPASVLELPEESNFGELHGDSVAMRQVFSLLARAAQSDATVLVVGESGTGKELVAQELVRRGPRANKPFVALDCSAISPQIIESELFGHVKGAFTGADRPRIGAFEAANGGTLFLDEIGEMPLDMQPKLLRALESREIRRIGDNQTKKVDVRVIAATNRSLEREVNRGGFRDDLYFRLSVISIRLPPLRERTDDIPSLVSAFLERMDAKKQAHFFTEQIFDELKAHSWPGNVRELRNYVERALVLADPSIPVSTRGSEAADVHTAQPGGASEVDIDEPFKLAKERVIGSFERAYLARLMAWAAGNVSRAARKAKIDRMYLHRLIQRYGIARSGERDSSPD